MGKDKKSKDGWQRRPKDGDARMKFEIVRTPAKKPIVGICLSHDIIGRYTHYYRGRTTPCFEEDCTACEEGNNARWHGWILLMDGTDGSKRILELTKAAVEQIDVYFKQHRTLRGAIIETRRVPERINGRIVVRIKRGRINTEELPNATDLKPILERMWDVPSRLTESEVQLKENDLPGQRELSLKPRSKASQNGDR